jgi:protein transport protein SEC13
MYCSIPSAFVLCMLTLRHEGPVWAVSWAHPKFGVKLASASYDRTVIVWACDESSATTHHQHQAASLHARATGSSVLSSTATLSSIGGGSVGGGSSSSSLNASLAGSLSSGGGAGLSYTASHWVKAYVYTGCELSVNSLAWAPHEMGLVLACGSSDGTVSILTHNGMDAGVSSLLD